MSASEWRVLLCDQFYQGSHPLGEPSLCESAFITLGMHCRLPLEVLCTFYRVSKHLRRLALKRIPTRSARILEDFGDASYDSKLRRFLLKRTLILVDERTLTLLPGRRCAFDNEAIYVDLSTLMQEINYKQKWQLSRTKKLLISLTRHPPSDVTRRAVAIGLNRVLRSTLTFKRGVISEYRKKLLYAWRRNKLQTVTMDPEWRALFAYRSLFSVFRIVTNFARWKPMKPHKKRASEVEQLKRDHSPKRK